MDKYHNRRSESKNQPNHIQPLITYIQDGSVAVGASRAEKVVVVRFAVGFSLPLEEVPGAQFLAAMGAGEVLWMPCFS